MRDVIRDVVIAALVLAVIYLFIHLFTGPKEVVILDQVPSTTTKVIDVTWVPYKLVGDPVGIQLHAECRTSILEDPHSVCDECRLSWFQYDQDSYANWAKNVLGPYKRDK